MSILCVFYVPLLYFILHAAFGFNLWLDCSGTVIMVGTVGLEGLGCMGRTDMGFWLDILLVFFTSWCFVIY